MSDLIKYLIAISIIIFFVLLIITAFYELFESSKLHNFCVVKNNGEFIRGNAYEPSYCIVNNKIYKILETNNELILYGGESKK